MRYTSDLKTNKSGIEMTFYVDKFSSDENEGCIEVKNANITDGEPLEKRATDDVMKAILTETTNLFDAMRENGYTTFKVTHGQGFMPYAYAFVRIRGLEDESDDGDSFGAALAEAYNLLTKEIRLAD